MDTTQTTSKAQYDAAQEAYVKAYLARGKALAAMDAAQAILHEAECAFMDAGEALSRHEVKPGVPRYMVDGETR